MGNIYDFFQGLTLNHFVRSMVVAPALLMAPTMFFQVSDIAKNQVDDTQWQELAVAFLQSPQIITPKINAARPFAISEVETFTRSHIEQALQQKKELDCLTTAIYYEARSEPIAGQLAVAQVVLNRTKSSIYPATVCEVVYQGANRTTGCQFSFTCDGSLQKQPRDKIWARSKASAINSFLGMSANTTIKRATHYHTMAVNPFWSSNLLRTANVGSHVFYRFPNTREKALLTKDI